MSDPASPTRILVSDFDSVHQAALWRERGAEGARDRLLSALRTAVLLGEDLTLDRNQLLDGVFFLTLGPDGVAHELGLGPHDRLPMVVKCQPGTVDGGTGRVVPVLRGAGAYAEQDVVVDVDHQLAQVRSDQFRSSSAAVAAVSNQEFPTRWLCGAACDEWHTGCGFSFFDRQTLEHTQILAAIEHAQDVWADAMLSGRVAVVRWDLGPDQDPHGARRDLDVPAALRSTRAFLDEHRDGLRPLAEHALALETPFRKEALLEVDGWLQEHPQVDPEEGRLAMEMWSRAYYRAIAQQDGALYLSFHDGVDDGDLPRAYGLTVPVRGRLERLRDRAFRARTGATLRVEGEILDHMAVISPGAFRQLYTTSRSTARRLIDEQDSGAMFDLAHAAREAVNQAESHARRRAVVVARLVTMTSLAVVVAVLGLVTDLGEMARTQQVLGVSVAAVLGLFAGLPWDDMMEMFRLRRASMTATLQLRTEEF